MPKTIDEHADPDNGVLLTLAEAKRAFYVDFEGRQGEPPVLLGLLRPSGRDFEFRQEVLDEDFASAAAAKNLPVVDIREAIEVLAEQVAAAGARVVAWSTHEWDLFRRYGSPSASAVLRDAYRNGIPLAKRWRTIFAPDWQPPKSRFPGRGRHSLSAYMARFGCEVPAAFGPYNTGQRLKATRDMLVKKEYDYSSLTGTVKAKWTKVLRHNEYDCFGMRGVCLGAARDLER